MKTILVISLALLCGCQVVPPATKLSIPTKYGLVNLASPRDSSLEGFKGNFETGDISLDKYSASNNPAVISATGDAQAQMLKAYAEIMQMLAQMGATMMKSQQELNRALDDVNRTRSDLERMKSAYPVPMAPPSPALPK